MKPLNLLLTACSLCVFLACSTGRERAAVPATPPPALEQPVRAPIAAHWQTEPGDKNSAHLTAHIQRFSTINAPIDVRFEVPPGVKITPAAESFRIPAGGPVELVRGFEVTWAEPPATDLLLVVDSRASDFGLHAEDAFRFGRPAPQPIRPERGPDCLKINGRDFGHPVQMTPQDGD